MGTKYLITGLPRSRTAWMAAFMGCPHEPTAHMDCLYDIEEFYEKNDGCSDSGMGWWLPWVLERIKPRVLHIVRPIDDVEKSLQNAFPEYPKTNYCEKLNEVLDKYWNHPLVKVVPYASLSDIAAMRNIFWHLQPGVPFDEGRYLKMNKERIVIGKSDIKFTGQLLFKNHVGVRLVEEGV